MVAMPFGLGKRRRPAKAGQPAKTRARLGVRGSLFMAFAGIAAMALTAITSIALARQQAPKITPPAR